MSAASVRTSGRRDNFPVLPKAAGNKREPGSLPRPACFKVLVQELFQLVVHGKLFLFSAFLFKSEQKPFPRRIIVLDLQIHDGTDPGESVSKDPKQSAIAEASVRGCLDHVQKLLNLAFDKCRRFAFGPRKSLGLDFPRRIHGQDTFFSQPGKQHPDGGHVLFDRGRCGLA